MGKDMLTFADRASMRLMKVRTLLYATEIVVNGLDISETEASHIANLLGVILDELGEAENAIEKCDLIERSEDK